MMGDFTALFECARATGSFKKYLRFLEKKGPFDCKRNEKYFSFPFEFSIVQRYGCKNMISSRVEKVQFRMEFVSEICYE